MKNAIILVIVILVCIVFVVNQPALLNFTRTRKNKGCNDNDDADGYDDSDDFERLMHRMTEDGEWIFDADAPPPSKSCPTNWMIGVVFEKTAVRTLQLEGGYTQNPKDSGNWTSGIKGVGDLVGTNHGISAPTFKAYFNRTPTAEEMQALTRQDALNISKALYWNPAKIGQMEDQALADLIFDCVYHHGIVGGVRILQQAINALGYNPRLYVDGKVGAKTIAAQKWFAQNNPSALYRKILSIRRDVLIARNNPTFQQGWLNRLATFTDY